MKRLNRIPIPASLKNRRSEILGEIKDNTIVDCVYNSILTGEIDTEVPKVDAKKYLPSYMKDYQVDDLNKALAMPNVFNINKPGYGKTLETIMWIKVLLKRDFKALILCPKSVISTWEDQLKKFWPEYAECGQWVITNYEQLYNKERQEAAIKTKWTVIVLDESHTIKSMKSKITRIVFKLTAEHKHCLTGTPIKNRPEDLAAQLKWLDNYSISTYMDFQRAFCDMEFNGFGYKPNGLTKNKTMVENLQKLLNIYCVGGKEHSVGNFDAPEYIKVKLKMDPAVKKLYDEVVGNYDKELKERYIDTAGLLEKGVKVSSAIESVVRRQQLTSNPQKFNPELKNVKFDWIVDWLEGTDENVVIFSKYAETTRALQSFLKLRKFNVHYVCKEQSSALRQAQVNAWNRNGQVLIGTYGVLGTGVDGLQTNCRYVIFVDRAWTASDNEQAEKRIWRTGQTMQPIIYILQCTGSIDIRIEHVQLDKGHDAAELLEPVIDEEENTYD